MTAPLVPAHINLRGLRYMPVDVVRLRDSDGAATSSGEGFRCALLLWCAAWHQLPAASLPDDDKVLANLVGMGRSPKDWRKIRAEALRNWIKCDDGRFYHPVVAEKAIEAWGEHLKVRFRNELARLKKAGERAKIKPYYPTFDEWQERYEGTGIAAWPLESVPGTDDAGPGDLPRDEATKGREGKGRDKASIHTPTRTDTPSGAEHLARALRESGWSECSSGHPDLIEALNAGVSEAEMRDAAQGCQGKPVSYVARRAIGRKREAKAATAPGTGATPAVDREALADRDWERQIDDLLIEARHLHEVLGMTTPDEYQAKLVELKARLAAGRPRAQAVTA